MNKSIIYKATEDKDIQEDLRKLEVLQKELKDLQKEQCEDAVSRQAVLDLLENTNNRWIINKVLRLPSVKPQKIGHWIRVASGSFIDKYVCSECKKTPSKRLINNITWGWDFTNYCPNCGAKMVEPQESEEEE